ncbi:MAG: DMT family transporter, partial [Pseudomonadota bacterium]
TRSAAPAPAPGPVPAPTSALAAATADRSVLLGIAWMAAFSIIAPGLDVFAKMAAATAPLGVIVLSRFVVQATLLGAVTWLARRPLPARADLPLHALRGVLIAAATLMFFAALRRMPLADAIAVFFVEPLILTALSALLLGERVGWRRWTACGVGFAGVLLVVQPNFAAAGPAALFPLGAAVCFALYLILTRRLSPRTDPFPMQTLAALSGGAVIGAALLIGQGTGTDFDPRWPVGEEWALLLGLGVFSTVSHLCVVMSLRHAPASVVAPVQYLELACAAFYGWAVFGDVPVAAAWAGMAIISASGLYVWHRERAAARR